MHSPMKKQCRGGRLQIFKKPKTGDPFINSTLTSVEFDADGAERFWISTVNALCGPSSLLVTETGGSRAYRWGKRFGVHYVYGVAAEDSDTLWLAGGGRFLFRVHLATGKWERFELPKGRFITAGMVYDPGTGKLFTGLHTEMASFDTRSCETVRVYEGHEKGPDSFHTDHWRNTDGSYGFILRTPGISYVRWHPAEERIEWTRLTDDPKHPAIPFTYHCGYVEGSCLYLPHLGWLDGLTGELRPHDGPPHEEAAWFGRRGHLVYGVQPDLVAATATFVCWDTSTAEVRTLFSLPDIPYQNCALTQSGKILTVDLRGVFCRHDADTGALELTRLLNIDSPHVGNTIVPAGRHTIVGTPFICQNFWTIDTRTGKGQKGGRAGGSYGQVDHALNVDGKVYFSIYGGSQLTVYDPAEPANFPRNPRLVAKSDQGQHGCGITTDGRVIWCAFRPKYGTLDGAMIRYDTQTGEATYRNAAIEHEHIVGPIYDPETAQLVAGTSFLSDCSTAVPTRDRCYMVTLCAETMEVTQLVDAPAGVPTTAPVGCLGPRRWLTKIGAVFGVFDEAEMTLTSSDELTAACQGAIEVLTTGTPGLFVIRSTEALLLWEVSANRQSPLATFRPGALHRCWVYGQSIYCDCGRRVAIFKVPTWEAACAI